MDAAFHRKHAEEKEAAQETAEHLAQITQLQRKLYADHNHSLLLVLQGIDGGMAAGGMSSVPWTPGV
jgi:polyphosphate kinase 2 (PPK2 family)